jgi:hypothetical protein
MKCYDLLYYNFINYKARSYVKKSIKFMFLLIYVLDFYYIKSNVTVNMRKKFPIL